MTINKYITQKFGSFGIQLSEADLIDISLTNEINGESEISKDNIREVSVAMAKFIPSLTIRPVSITEGSYSQTIDLSTLENYYHLLCRRYDIEDEFTANPVQS